MKTSWDIKKVIEMFVEDAELFSWSENYIQHTMF